jgi:hypothetical protein
VKIKLQEQNGAHVERKTRDEWAKAILEHLLTNPEESHYGIKSGDSIVIGTINFYGELEITDAKVRRTFSGQIETSRKVVG